MKKSFFLFVVMCALALPIIAQDAGADAEAGRVKTSDKQQRSVADEESCVDSQTICSTDGTTDSDDSTDWASYAKAVLDFIKG